ncbi:MAG: hypothetical protein J5647_05665 [Spirochaetaceae bacterium]|nr:hypothetical protein [Spirochaetaceae bacterium]
MKHSEDDYMRLKAENARLTRELEQAYEQIIKLKSGTHEKPKTAREAAEAADGRRDKPHELFTEDGDEVYN